MSLLNIKSMFNRTSGPNVEKLRAVLDHVTNNPRQWDQYAWSYCLAGHTVKLDGHTIDNRVGFSIGMFSAGGPGVQTTDGKVVPRLAAELLNLTAEQAARLFNSENHLAALWIIANEITDGKVGWPDPNGGPAERVVRAAKARELV